MTNQHKKLYIPLVISVLLIFTFADEAGFDNNKQEKKALKEISESTDQIVEIQSDCPVLSWEKISNPDNSRGGGELLHLWGISSDKKLYYNK